MVINKKKVLIFIPEFPGLTETFIEREVSKLAESNSLQVEVLSLKKGTGTLSKPVELITSYTRLELFHLFLSIKYLFLYPKRVFKALTIILGNKNRDLRNNLYLFVKALGYMSAPVVIVGDVEDGLHWSGFRNDKISNLKPSE